MESRKAQGLSMTTIVIAALSLLVLVVLVLIFTGRMGLFSGGVDESSKCETYCTSLGKNAQLEYQNTDAAKGVCRENGGDVIPAINGATEENICCCVPK